MLTSETGELRFIEELKRRGYRDIIRAEGYFPDWDIQTNLGTYEIKDDVLASKTGRIFVEYAYRDKPSGLAATKADYFVVLVGDSAHVTTVHNWRDFLRSSWPYLQKGVGGDNNWSKGVFVSPELLTASRVSGLETWKLLQTK